MRARIADQAQAALPVPVQHQRLAQELDGLDRAVVQLPAAPMGCQYRRSNSPMGVPGPTLVSRSFSLTVSMAPPFACNFAGCPSLSRASTVSLAPTGRMGSQLQHGLLETTASYRAVLPCHTTSPA